MQGALWEANFHKKKTYGLGIMKLFSFRTKHGQLKKIYFQDIFCQFFGNLFLTKFLLKLQVVVYINFTRAGFKV